MKQYYLNKNNNFIDGYYLTDLSLCDKLVDLFENNKEKFSGQTSSGIDKTKKDSLDIKLNIIDVAKHKVLNIYLKQLSDCLSLYKEKYKFCDKGIAEFGLEYNWNIQKYKPSQGFHAFHCEKSDLYSSKRHLVWMTYLNDVKQGGETEFYYQKLKIKPEKGLTLIWSADWTFTHKGHTTIDEDKYIITGWYELKK